MKVKYRLYIDSFEVWILVTSWENQKYLYGGGGVLQGILDGGVPPSFPNPDPILDPWM